MAKTSEDVEARRRKIEIRSRMLALEAPDPEGGAFRRYSAGTSRAAAKMVGAPVDIVNSLLSLVGAGHEAPAGGSRNIMQMLEKVGMGVSEDAELGRAGRVGELHGTVALASPAIVAVGLRSLAAETVTRVPSITTALVQDVAKNFARNPVTFAASEATFATGAGLASFEASQRWPDSPGAQALAEIGGGIAPIATVMATRQAGRLTVKLGEKLPIAGFFIRGIRNAWNAISIPAQTSRSIARVQRATPDPLKAAANLKRTDIIENSGLTSAQRAGDPGLLSLEASVMRENTDLAFSQQQQFTQVNSRIRESLVETPVDDVPTHQVKAYFQSLLDIRIQQAALKADERLAALGTTATREDLNLFAREELNRAKIDARGQEKQLYDAIPMEARVPTQAGQETLEAHVLSVPKAQRGDIPEEALRFLRPEKLNAKGELAPNPDFLGSETTVNEIRGLQSKLGETARVARSNGEFNKARIADDIKESLKDDIGNASGGPDVKEKVDVAIQFSSDLNDRFTRGHVGRLLGSERSGGQLVPPALTLETSVANRGPRAAVTTDALLNAVKFQGTDTVMRGHIQEFLIDDLRRAAVKEGRLVPAATQRWLDSNQDVLKRFPDLVKDVRAAQGAGGRLIDAERLNDPKISRAAVFINAPPGAEIERVIRTANPREAAQELLAMARTDPTGAAEQGLKAAFFERLLQKAEITGSRVALDLNDQPFISGSLLSTEMSREPVVEFARGLLGKAEMERLNKVIQTARLFDGARNSPGAVEGIIGDHPNVLFSILGRIGGAQIGRFIAGKTGGGTVQTPGILAAQIQRLLQAGVSDPAKRLLTDAVQDEKLFKALLMPMDTPQGERIVRARINAWVLDVLNEQNEVEK